MVITIQSALKTESNQLSEDINLESGPLNMVGCFSCGDIEYMEEDEYIETMVLDGSIPGFHSTTSTSIHSIGQENDGQTFRVPNKKRRFRDVYNLLKNLYFNEGHVKYENDFERRFTIPRVLFEILCYKHI